jgi:hypothetical protein
MDHESAIHHIISGERLVMALVYLPFSLSRLTTIIFRSWLFC